MMSAGDLRLESASFSHDGGRDYNEDAVGDSDAFGAVRLFMLADGAGGHDIRSCDPALARWSYNLG